VHNKEPDHDHGGPATGLVRGPVVLISCYDNGDDEVAECHADGADYQDWLSAEFVDIHDCWNCCLFV